MDDMSFEDVNELDRKSMETMGKMYAYGFKPKIKGSETNPLSQENISSLQEMLKNANTVDDFLKGLDGNGAG
jgi:hypothetical protein